VEYVFIDMLKFKNYEIGERIGIFRCMNRDHMSSDIY
jgi:hypothetical protein